MSDQPIIPFIEGDGTGPDIWRASVRVFDAAVAKAYGGKRKIVWKEVLAGEKALLDRAHDRISELQLVAGLPLVERRQHLERILRRAPAIDAKLRTAGRHRHGQHCQHRGSPTHRLSKPHFSGANSRSISMLARATASGL